MKTCWVRYNAAPVFGLKEEIRNFHDLIEKECGATWWEFYRAYHGRLTSLLVQARKRNPKAKSGVPWEQDRLVSKAAIHLAAACSSYPRDAWGILRASLKPYRGKYMVVVDKDDPVDKMINGMNKDQSILVRPYLLNKAIYSEEAAHAKTEKKGAQQKQAPTQKKDAAAKQQPSTDKSKRKNRHRNKNPFSQEKKVQVDESKNDSWN